MQLVKQTNVQQALKEPTEEARQAAYEEAIDPSFDRKVTEMKIAIGLEKRYTKKEILAAYLNIAYFGEQAYGIQAAAQRYFGIDAKDLNLQQAASLVAIVQFPERRNLGDAANFDENWDGRAVYILDAMLDAGHITQEQYDEAVVKPDYAAFVADGAPPQQGCRTAMIEFRWACDYIVKSVKDFEFLGSTPQEREANWARGGYKLYTTIDLDMQATAQQAENFYAPPDFPDFAFGSSVVTMEPGTGKIRVMVQNKVFDDAFEPDDPVRSSAVNFNTTSAYGNSTGKQVGSTYKLFTLLQWMIAGHGVNEVIDATEGDLPSSKWRNSCGDVADYWVKNDSNESGGYTVRSGTWNSVNGVFLRMATQLDLCDINNLAAKMGVVRADGTPLFNGPSSILGINEIAPISMAQAYATVAAGGKTCKPMIVNTYTDPRGIAHTAQTPQCTQVLDPDIAASAIDVMTGVMSVTASVSNPDDGVPIFGKTGTNDDAENTWVITSTTANTTVVWTGNIVGHYSMYRVYNPAVSDPYCSEVRQSRHCIMHDVMTALNGRYSGAAFPTPSGDYNKGSSANVPNVSGIGLTFDQAKQSLLALGFLVEDAGPIDSDMPKDTVAKQDPAADAPQIGFGSTVKLWRSLANMTQVPDVSDGSYTYADAKAEFRAAKYKDILWVAVCASGFTEVDGFDDVNGLTVIGQDPAGGAMAVTGAEVTLTLQLDKTDPDQCDKIEKPGGKPTSDPDE
jgi:membrane peptidoglycan carboxypeptidase